jgi:hypothetical protein
LKKKIQQFPFISGSRRRLPNGGVASTPHAKDLMRRYFPLLIAGVALIAAACSDSITPRHSESAQGSKLTVFGAPVAFITAVDPNVHTDTVVFTLDPAGGSVKVGDFWIDYEANAVCDPSTSGYGPETWDLPCETLTEPITITATYWWENGLSYVDFSPDIRFSPDKQVLTSTVRPTVTAAGLGYFKMWYFRTIDNTRYVLDEAAVDETLVTQHDYPEHLVWRRMKHFSGITLSSGSPCEATLGDPDCVASVEILDY